MRLIVREAQQSHDTVLDILNPQDLELQLPFPESWEAYPDPLIAFCHGVTGFIEHQHVQLELAFHIESGVIMLFNSTWVFQVQPSRNSDHLKLDFYEQMLERWYHFLQHAEISRSALEILDHLRQQIFRLRSDLDQPDAVYYPFL